MLDDVREVDVLETDARLFESPSKQLSGGTDEWPSFAILDVAGLLADEHDSDAGRALAKHRLRRMPPQIAAATHLGVLSHRTQRHACRSRAFARGHPRVLPGPAEAGHYGQGAIRRPMRPDEALAGMTLAISP
jgi:hypothetical protein